MAPPSRFAYPVALDLHDVVVIVVGAGPIAARKVAGLAAAGAIVNVVAPDVSTAMTEAVDDGQVARLRQGEFEPSDLDGVRLVITATGIADVDASVATHAKAAGIWVNAADQPSDCTFILPAVARNGPLTVAVSTDGSSPALARRLRDRAASLLTDEVVALAGQLRVERARVRVGGASTEDRDWSEEIDPVLPPAG